MALIAIHTVIDIIWIALVSRIGLGLGVAIRALEDGIVARIGVAGRAHTVRAAVGHREPGMVERSPRPCRGVVASRAGGGKNGRRRLMNWIRGAVVVCLVATVAGRRKRGVVVIYVASGAGDSRVESRQRERGGVVVKLSICPQRGVMAELAGRGEAYLDMVNGSGCCVVIV